MKLFVLLATVGVLYTTAAFELDDIEVPEGGALVKEHVVLDKTNGIATAHTGKHNGRMGVTELIDSEHGIVANRFDKDDDNKDVANKCVISEADRSIDLTPNEASHAMELTNKKMPDAVVQIHKMYVMEPFENVASLPRDIKKFCRGLRVVRKRVIESLEEANKVALKEAKAAKKNSRKRMVLREFTACTNKSTLIIMTCPSDKLKTSCKIRTNTSGNPRESCTYWIRCPMDLNKGGFDCKGLHKLNSMVCCDYSC